MYGVTAQKNYFQSPNNQYAFNGQTISPVVNGNYCDNAAHSGATTFSGCTTTGFTNPPTVTFTLGNLSAGVVPFTATNFTAQYGAVKWFASTSSTTPGSGDAGWSFTPPVSLPVTHGSTVYMWAMDSLLHIGAAAPQVVP